ncbi:hypothetical protein Q8W30_00030 [Neptunomonas phycophila]|uniref:DUF4305 domain-containing protein n=1 Tax=Neptunomonas phycophila TaxID=1572645 RepID=A0ABT9EPE4_9GAMM|nr:hypothetical protein [Neptunomonas phycophila]MDP2520940.1 hypothetical protein [Neptunomonas phycophila]
MNITKKYPLLPLWLIIGTVAYALVWSRNLDSFPEFPEWVGTWVFGLIGDKTSAEGATVFYMLILSFVMVSIFTLLVWVAIRAFRKG